MRSEAFLALLGMLSACSDDPSAQIIVPLPDTTVVAAVELRMKGHQLTNAETRIYLDLNRYSDSSARPTGQPLPDDALSHVASSRRAWEAPQCWKRVSLRSSTARA